MSGAGPRARAIATGALLGDPPPGRTPWAAPAQPNEVPRTGLSPTTAKFDAPAPQFAKVEDIRKGEADRSEPSRDEIARLCGPEDDAEAAQPEGTYSQTVSADSLRAVVPISLIGLEPTTPTSTGPIFEWVAPETLLVNEAYQRDLSDRSIKLIRKIVAGWDWTKFKAPVCSLGENGLEIIDGQHTAIAAATHPGISQIPVMIVETETVAARADAFIGQNLDRLGVTKMQMHRAAVASGDRDALTIDEVCLRSGVRLLMAKPHRWKVGDSVAVVGIAGLIDRRRAVGARKVLDVLVAADAAPVTANGIKAVEMILFDTEYADADPDHLATAIRASGDAGEREAAVFSSAHRVPLWKALGVVWFKKCKKRRSGG